METADQVPEIMVTESRSLMDKEDTVHISFVEGQQTNRDMESEPGDDARSSFISTNSSGTSGTSEADDSNYRDSVISYSSVDSMDRNSLFVTEGHPLGRVGSTRSMPPERIHHDSDGSEEGYMLSKEVARKTLSRKTAIRRNHTLTPNSSPKVTQRRHRSISSTDSPLPELQKGQKEYFTLSFELRFYTQTHVVEAAQGVTLRDALKPILASADIDIRTIDVFIESSSSSTPLELPVFPLSGRCLHVKAKTGKKSHTVSSPNFNRRKMDDAENGDTSGDPFLGTAPMRKDMSKFFGVEQCELQPTPRQPVQPNAQKKDLNKLLGINQQDPVVNTSKKGRRDSVASMQQSVTKDPAKEKVDPKLLKLQQTLDDFMINGLPDFSALLTFTTKREDDEESFQLEDSWRELGDEEALKELNKKQTDQQEAIWEIIKTEVGYIKNIRIIVDFYLYTLINLQASAMLNEIETEKIFSNISAIEKLHSRFWKEKLSNVVKKAREEKRILAATDLAEAFEGFADLFAPYIKFCTDENECMKYLRERTKDNEMLRFFVDWAQRHPNSRRLKLQDLLVYPMQRITKYPLLLIAVEKKTLDEQDNADVGTRISEVKEFVMRVNHELRQEQERQKMEETISRLEAYDAVSVPSGCEELAKMVEEHSALDLMCSMPNAPPNHARWLLMKGSLKLRDGDSRVDAYGFLFTDMFILTKLRKSENFKIFKPPMRVDMIKVQELKDGSGFALLHVDEYNCAVYGCVLSTSNAPGWVQKIEQARDLYNSICNFDAEFRSDGEVDDGSGEPPTSPEAMVFLNSTSFPFTDNSPSSSPLNSPKLGPRHLLPPVDIRRAHSSSSLSMAGGVSPVPEENGEEEEQNGGKEPDVSGSGGLEMSRVNADSTEDILNSVNEHSRPTFPPSKRQSQNEDGLRQQSGLSPTSPNVSVEEAPSRTKAPPKEISVPRPAQLTIPTGPSLSASPTSPGAGIIAFDDSDDDETAATDNTVHAIPGSPKRRTSAQVPVTNSPKKGAQRRVTAPSRPEGMTKMNGDDSKQKGKLRFFPKKKSSAGK